MATVPRRRAPSAGIAQPPGLPAASASFSPFKEIGRSGVAVFGGRIVSRERGSQVIGPQRYVTYADMAANVSIVAASVRYFLNVLSSATWTISPAATKNTKSPSPSKSGKASEEDGAEGVKDAGDGSTAPKEKAFGKFASNDADVSGDSQKIAELIESILEDMNTPLRRVIKRGASYRFHGFGIQEWTAKKRDDGGIGIEDIEVRPQHTIELWDVDEKGTVKGVWQTPPQTGQALYLPRGKILYLVEDSLTDSPEGMGLYRHLVEPYNRLKKYLLLEGQGFERDLRGIPIGRVPYQGIASAVKAGAMTKAEGQNLTLAIENFVKLQSKSEDTSIVLDSAPYVVDTESGKSISGIMQYGLELLQGQAADFGGLHNAIERLNMEMARVIGTEHLLLGGGGSANRALSEDKSRNFYLTANGSLDDMADAINKDIIGPICDLNGIPDHLRPKASHSDVSFRAISEITAALRDMATAGAVLAPDDPAVNDVRELLGLPEAKPPDPAMFAALQGVKPGDEEEDPENPDAGKPPKGKKPNPFASKGNKKEDEESA
jgi:hypothetical protein